MCTNAEKTFIAFVMACFDFVKSLLFRSSFSYASEIYGKSSENNSENKLRFTDLLNPTCKITQIEHTNNEYFV